MAGLPNRARMFLLESVDVGVFLSRLNHLGMYYAPIWLSRLANKLDDYMEPGLKMEVETDQ